MCSAALVYGAKHGGFASLRHLPGLLGSTSTIGGLPSGAFPASSTHGTSAKAGHQLLTATQGLGAAPRGAPSPVYGPIGGPRPDFFGAGSTCAAARHGGGAPALTGGGRPRTPSPLPPLPTDSKRSNR